MFLPPPPVVTLNPYVMRVVPPPRTTSCSPLALVDPPPPPALPHLDSAEDMLGAEGEALRWFPYPWEGGSASSSSIPGTNAAGPTEASAVTPPAEGTGAPTAAGKGGHGMGPLPPHAGELSSSPSPSPSSSSGRCIIKPAVYGPGVEGADAAALAGATAVESRTGQREGGAAQRSLNGAATPAAIAGAAVAAASSAAGGESIAAGQAAGSRDGGGFPEAVAAVAETRSPGPDRSAELRGAKGRGSAGAPPGTTGLADGASVVKMKPSLKVSRRFENGFCGGRLGCRAFPLRHCTELLLTCVFRFCSCFLFLAPLSGLVSFWLFCVLWAAGVLSFYRHPDILYTYTCFGLPRLLANNSA